MDDLARRAVACPRWRWLPGMLTQHGRICGAGYLVSNDVDEGGQPYVDCTDTIDDWSGLLPDLNDPCTRGALLALVREAWGCPHLSVVGTPGDWRVDAAGVVGVRDLHSYKSEAEALMAALEAAP